MRVHIGLPNSAQSHSLDDLERLSGLPRRTIRYYIQLGLVDRPLGETRAATYSSKHLSQLLRIRELSDAGLSLEAIRTRLQAPESPAPSPAPGTARVLSHIALRPGVELVVDPSAATLTPEQLRQLAREVLAACDRLAPHKEEKR